MQTQANFFVKKKRSVLKFSESLASFTANQRWAALKQLEFQNKISSEQKFSVSLRPFFVCRNEIFFKDLSTRNKIQFLPKSNAIFYCRDGIRSNFSDSVRSKFSWRKSAKNKWVYLCKNEINILSHKEKDIFFLVTNPIKPSHFSQKINKHLQKGQDLCFPADKFQKGISSRFPASIKRIAKTIRSRGYSALFQRESKLNRVVSECI